MRFTKNAPRVLSGQSKTRVSVLNAVNKKSHTFPPALLCFVFLCVLRIERIVAFVLEGHRSLSPNKQNQFLLRSLTGSVRVIHDGVCRSTASDPTDHVSEVQWVRFSVLPECPDAVNDENKFIGFSGVYSIDDVE